MIRDLKKRTSQVEEKGNIRNVVFAEFRVKIVIFNSTGAVCCGVDTFTAEVISV